MVVRDEWKIIGFNLLSQFLCFFYFGTNVLTVNLNSRSKLNLFQSLYRGADKSLAIPGSKQATATEDFDFHISIYDHNWRNISTIFYIYIYIYIVYTTIMLPVVLYGCET